MSLPILTVGPVARARNGVIGRAGGLPWRIKSDLALFKELTLFKPIIMGRKTWDSLPLKPLPGRMNIVLSRDGSFEPHKALVCETFNEAVDIAREQAEEDGAEEVCVIGGHALFELALPRLVLAPKADLFAFDEADVAFEGYDPHPLIRAPIAV